MGERPDPQVTRPTRLSIHSHRRDDASSADDADRPVGVGIWRLVRCVGVESEYRVSGWWVGVWGVRESSGMACQASKHPHGSVPATHPIPPDVENRFSVPDSRFSLQ